MHDAPGNEEGEGEGAAPLLYSTLQKLLHSFFGLGGSGVGFGHPGPRRATTPRNHGDSGTEDMTLDGRTTCSRDRGGRPSPSESSSGRGGRRRLRSIDAQEQGEGLRLGQEVEGLLPKGQEIMQHHRLRCLGPSQAVVAGGRLQELPVLPAHVRAVRGEVLQVRPRRHSAEHGPVLLAEEVHDERWKRLGQVLAPEAPKWQGGVEVEGQNLSARVLHGHQDMVVPAHGLSGARRRLLAPDGHHLGRVGDEHHEHVVALRRLHAALVRDQLSANPNPSHSHTTPYQSARQLLHQQKRVLFAVARRVGEDILVAGP
mmetsp:Transcript_12594/g.46524  ORF Transcript_12594/g.46524 Transcript_12594/m.46524 type:complete len:314 (+) Transcript_12594:1039-1980(+)